MATNVTPQEDGWLRFRELRAAINGELRDMGNEHHGLSRSWRISSYQLRKLLHYVPSDDKSRPSHWSRKRYSQALIYRLTMITAAEVIGEPFSNLERFNILCPDDALVPPR